MAQNHRKPPLPESMTQPRRPGWCRWCGLEILVEGKRVTRRTWHPECVTEYFITCSSKEQRKALFQRDKGICAKCGIDTCEQAKSGVPEDQFKFIKCGRRTGRFWQADHVVALVNAGRDLRMWTLENLQTLCTKCHTTKTADDIRKARAR